MQIKGILFILSCSFIFPSCRNQNPKEEEELPQVHFITAPSPQGSSLPYLVKGGDGFLYMSWTEELVSNVTVLKYSKYVDGNWSMPELIARGKDWFVNWADYPMIAIDKQGNMIAHYLAKSTAGTYSYDVNILIKPADKAGWSAPFIPHKDGTATEHGFVTLLPQNDGTFLLGWLDGRNTAGNTHDKPGGPMTLRSAVLDMNGHLTQEVELDGRVCDCCQTSGVQTARGPILAYRNRSELEIRDLAVVRRVNGEWTSSAIVYDDHWEVHGCPVNGPRLAAIDSSVSIAWFTAANNFPKVNFSFSNDQGQTFEEPLTIASTTTVGRVDVSMTDSSTAFVSWLDTSDSTSIIMLRKVNLDGELGKPIVVAETSASRASGFPQMVFTGNELIMAWTDVQNERPEIKMANISLPSSQ